MKKLVFVLLGVSFVIGARAQLVTADELKSLKVQLFGNQKWKTIAKTISSYNILDDNKSICYVKVLNTPERTKEELFDTMKSWITDKFGGTDGGIQLVDRENFLIIARGSVRDVVQNYVYGGDEYTVSLNPIIRIETKDGRVRVSITIPSYIVHRHDYAASIDKDELWAVSSCYPFAPAGLDTHSQTSSKALVMAHICSTRFLEIIENAVYHYKPNSVKSDNW